MIILITFFKWTMIKSILAVDVQMALSTIDPMFSIWALKNLSHFVTFCTNVKLWLGFSRWFFRLNRQLISFCRLKVHVIFSFFLYFLNPLLIWTIRTLITFRKFFHLLFILDFLLQIRTTYKIFVKFNKNFCWFLWQVFYKLPLRFSIPPWQN